MSEQPASPGVPQWDVADRMRKALREADISVQQMAVYLDVSRNTVSTWINGRIKPSIQTQRLWAMRCGVSYNWLHHGTDKPCFGGGESLTSDNARFITGRYRNTPEFAILPALFFPVAA